MQSCTFRLTIPFGTTNEVIFFIQANVKKGFEVLKALFSTKFNNSKQNSSAASHFKMTGWKIESKLRKWQGGHTSERGTEAPKWRIHGRNALDENVLDENALGEMSWDENVLGWKCPKVIMSWYQNALRQKGPVWKCPKEKMPQIRETSKISHPFEFN